MDWRNVVVLVVPLIRYHVPMNLSLLLFVHLPLALATPNDWLCWRGADGTGVSRETGWAAEGATEDLWRRNVGFGYACASIAGERVFTAGFDPERGVDVIWCLAAETGDVLWQDEYASELLAHNHAGGVLSTPTLDGERLYVTNRLGGLRCYEAETGRLLWFQDLARLQGTDPGYYGFGTSPVVRGDKLYVAMGGLYALDKHRGDLLWATAPLEARYSTPAPFEVGGESLLALFTHNGLEIIAALDGEQRAFHPWQKDQRRVNAATPVVIGERIFISSAYEHGCALLELHEGELREVWANRGMRNKMAGCVLVNGHLYGFDESMLKCFDLDGEERWRVRGLGNGAISGAPGRLLITTSRGDLVVAEASPDEFRELSRVKLCQDGVFWSPPVLAGGRIYFRSNEGELVCRDHRVAPPVAAATGGREDDTQVPEAGALFERHLEHIGGSEAWSTHSSMSLFGSFAMHSVGVTPATLRIDYHTPNLWRQRFALPAPLEGDVTQIFDGELGFELNPYRGDSLFEPDVNATLAETRRLHGALTFAADYPELRTVGAAEFSGRDCWQVEARSKAGLQRSFYFERESGLLAGHGGEAEEVLHFHDYRAFDDLLVPTRMTRFVAGTGIEESFQIESVEFDTVEPDAFKRPDAIQALVDEGR